MRGCSSSSLLVNQAVDGCILAGNVTLCQCKADNCNAPGAPHGPTPDPGKRKPAPLPCCLDTACNDTAIGSHPGRAAEGR